MRIVLYAFLLVGLSSALSPRQASTLDGSLVAEGAALVLRLADGRVLRQDALTGIRLMLNPRMQVRIDSVGEDGTAHGGPVPLYHLSVIGPGHEPDSFFCLPDAHGRRAAVLLPHASGGFSFTCTSGAEGKCILFGYRPWEAGQGIPMADLHRACIHMLRADYGGDDRPTTRDGTSVDIYDRYGIQKADGVEAMAFEAAWGPNGAICVAHARIPDNVSLGELVARYPRLAGYVGPEGCSEEAMRGETRAILFNRSHNPSR